MIGQNQSVLAAALQTAFNLRVMPNIVQSLLLDLTEAVDARIKSAFDVSRIAKEITGKGNLTKSSSFFQLISIFFICRTPACFYGPHVSIPHAH
jgi:hypothetical protein